MTRSGHVPRKRALIPPDTLPRRKALSCLREKKREGERRDSLYAVHSLNALKRKSRDNSKRFGQRDVTRKIPCAEGRKGVVIRAFRLKSISEIIREIWPTSPDGTEKFRDQRTCLLALIGTFGSLRATVRRSQSYVYTASQIARCVPIDSHLLY